MDCQQTKPNSVWQPEVLLTTSSGYIHLNDILSVNQDGEQDDVIYVIQLVDDIILKLINDNR